MALREGSVPGLSPQLEDDYLFPVFSHLSPVCICLYAQISPFYKDASHIRLESTLMTSV